MPYVIPRHANVFPDFAEAHQVGQQARTGAMANALLRERLLTAPEQRKSVELANALAQEQLPNVRARREYMQAQTEATRQQMGTRDLTDRLQRWKTGLGMLGTVKDRESYVNTLKTLEGMFPDTFMQDFGDLPPPDVLERQADLGENPYEEFAQEMSDFSEELSGKGTTTGTFGQPKAGVDEQGKPVYFQTDKEGNVQVVGRITPEPKKGMKIYDPTTGHLLVDTSGGAPEMQKKTLGAIEEKIVSGKEQLARMSRIYGEFRPEFQEVGTRLSAAWTGLKARLGQNISKEDEALLVDFKKFQRKAIENINLYIKELTGAQMSEKEADRLRLAQPDPGEKWWKGDDPVTFRSKMEDVIKTTRAAIARYEWYRSQGMDDTQIKNIINRDMAVPLQQIAARIR